MPATSERGKSGRSSGRGRSASSSGSSRASSASRSRPTRTTKRDSANGDAPDTAKSAKSQATSRASRSDGSQGKGGEGKGGDSKGGVMNAVIPLATAAIGVAGGVLLGRGGKPKTRKVLGVEIPSSIDLSGIGEQIGEAGKQFGKLAGEVNAMRQKAEQVGKALG